MGREPSETEVVEAFRAEVGAWAPRRVPNLADLTRPAPSHWERPVMLASGLGATALAFVLLLCAALVLIHPDFPGSSDLVERISLIRP